MPRSEESPNFIRRQAAADNAQKSWRKVKWGQKKPAAWRKQLEALDHFEVRAILRHVRAECGEKMTWSAGQEVGTYAGRAKPLMITVSKRTIVFWEIFSGIVRSNWLKFRRNICILRRY